MNSFDSIEAAFQEIENVWGGFIQVSMRVELGKFEGLSPKAIRSIFQVTNEAMANAWRHGGATTAQVELSRNDQSFTLTVRDDGTLAERWTPGLGVALFNEISESNWQLSPQVGSGTVLKLNLPSELFS